MKRQIAAYKIVFLSLMVLCLVTACGGQASTPITQQESINTTPEVTPASPAEAITLTDALDRVVTLEEPPRRIALAGRSLAILGDAVYLFPEAVERLVVTGKASQDTAQFESLIDPAYAEKAVLESEVSAEQVAAYNPDLVLLKSSMAESLGTSLETLGIPVVYLDFETPQQYERDLTNLGILFQNEERAAELIAYYQQHLNEVQERLEDVPAEQKPKALLIYYNDRDGSIAYNVPPMNWIQTQMVETSGAEPVWKEAQLGNGWTKVNFEQIAVWDPEQIYLVAYFNNPEEITANLKNDPQWQELTAVKNGKLYAFPKDFISWDQSNPRWVLGLMWLGATAHPEQFADFDLQEEMRYFFEDIYKISPEIYRETILPRLQGDIN